MTVTFWTVALALAAAALIMAQQSAAEQRLESKITWRNRGVGGQAQPAQGRVGAFSAAPSLAYVNASSRSLPAWVERRRRSYGR